jgi:hypothetical protein
MAAPSDPENPVSLKGDFDWKGLSQKTWVIVLAGLVIPPLGMMLTWLKPGWTTRTRWVATGLTCIASLAWIGIDKRSTKDTETQTWSEAQENAWSDRMAEKRSKENIERGRKIYDSLK